MPMYSPARPPRGPAVLPSCLGAVHLLYSLTWHCHIVNQSPQSSLCAVCSVGVDPCAMTWIRHYSISGIVSLPKTPRCSLAGMAQLVWPCPAKRKVTGLIPSQGTCLGGRFSPPTFGVQARGNRSTFLSLSPFLSLCLKISK